MGQQTSNARQNLPSHRNYQRKIKQKPKQKRIDHQGILKLRSVPFKNCIQIQNDEAPLFLENAQITLKDLLECRLYTNKLFPVEDVERLIQHLIYTLAFMQQNGISYKDINSEYVYYHNGGFKLLPNQLILQSIYQKFKRTVEEQPAQQQILEFVTLSPEMIIAYRCKQAKITDKQILDKSNVFCLGLMLLQVCTLLPSRQCYDTQTFDILDQVFIQRINLVQEYYNPHICKIIANMLDYDYSQRMDLKQASIFVNRQLNQNNSAKITPIHSQLTKSKQNQQEVKSAQKSRTLSSLDNQDYSNQKDASISVCSNHKDDSIRKKAKKNQVYLTAKFEEGLVQKNDDKSYSCLDKTSKSRVSGVFSQISNNSLQSAQTKNYPKNNQVYRKSTQNLHLNLKSTYKDSKANIRQQQNENPHRISKYSNYEYYDKNQKDYSHPEEKYKEYSDYRNKNNGSKYYEDDTFSKDQPQSQRQSQKRVQRNYIEEPQKKYYQNSRPTEQVKRRNQSKFQMYQAQNEEESDRYAQHVSFGKTTTKFQQQPEKSDSDHSLARIKQQIQKSRKLISQFKKADMPRF